MSKVIRAKERETIIQSLRSGVVPRVGLQHIQVGRSDELKSFIKDLETIADGGSSFRLIIGDYGSGKTFFLDGDAGGSGQDKDRLSGQDLAFVWVWPWDPLD